jgi:hypothetical protein
MILKSIFLAYKKRKDLESLDKEKKDKSNAMLDIRGLKPLLANIINIFFVEIHI